MSSLTVGLGLFVRPLPECRVAGLVRFVLQGPGTSPLDAALVPGLGTEGLGTIVLVEGEFPDLLPLGFIAG